MPVRKNLTRIHHHLISIFAKTILIPIVYRCLMNHYWERITLTWFRDTKSHASATIHAGAQRSHRDASSSKSHAGAQRSHWDSETPTVMLARKVMPVRTNLIEIHPCQKGMPSRKDLIEIHPRLISKSLKNTWFLTYVRLQWNGESLRKNENKFDDWNSMYLLKIE